MKVPLFSLKRVLKPSINQLKKSFDLNLEDCKFIMGSDVFSFEENFSTKVGARHTISMSSGTDALLSIFMALDLEPGSEIIVPSFTFVASASSIARAGLKPVFVDISKDSFHPSIDDIKAAWTKNTKGVLFVHLFGECEDLSELKKLCDEKNAFLIEDCAQSYGSGCGKLGLASAYSFFPAKNIGCLGDGGAVTTNDDDFAKKIKVLRSHGSSIKYNYEMLGGNFRLDTIQAGFLNILLDRVDLWIEKRKNNAAFYDKKLSNIGDLILPRNNKNHAWNQYTIRTEYRDELKKHLDNNNIGNAVYYPIPLHYSSKIFKDTYSLPETEKRCKQVLSLPVYPGLLEKERKYVVEKIKEFFDDTQNGKHI